MSGLLQIVCGAAQGSAFEVRIRHTSDQGVVEAATVLPRITSPQDEESIRWYLEEYLLYPFDPAPELAVRVEQRMREIGAELFRDLFDASPNARAIWQSIRGTLSATRIEILGDFSEDPIFWELIRSPLDAVPLACAAQSFVHVARGMEERATSEPFLMRVLMVIARPRGADDVRFRSVAARVLQRMQGQQTFEFEVLRPPTFEALERKLRSAHARGKPFTVLHFDGHGTYEDLMERFAGTSSGVKRGYLMFEDPEIVGMADPISGDRLGQLLHDYGVQIVLLNACRSARAEISSSPSNEGEIGSARSFGSLAIELMEQAIGAVVAMRYNIYVDTAAQFVATAYEKLAASESINTAVMQARRDLYDQPRRASVGSMRKLADWMVPVLFEHHPITVNAGASESEIRWDTSTLPVAPPAGFIGRDNSLLELDRQFQSSRLVLLWGQVGNGKTATAAEFARWLSDTGGLEGPILFTSFLEACSLSRVVDSAAASFQEQPRTQEIEWLTLDVEGRVRALVDLLRTTPGIWIWDNVDSIGKDGWSAEEVTRVGKFLNQVATTGVRILLTSREQNLPWTGVGLVPLELPAMDPTERLELAAAIAGPDVEFGQEIWTPLFQFSQGNPFVLSLLVHLALEQGIDSTETMKGFLDAVRTSDDAGLFAASVDYALSNRFTTSEQELLSLAYLFEYVVNQTTLDILSQKRDPDVEVPDITQEGVCGVLLERAASLGVLTSRGSGYYAVHPGLPGHFGRIYVAMHTSEEQNLLERSFAWLHGTIARVFSKQFESGKPGSADVAMGTLALGEPNLRRALSFARRHARWYDAMNLMRGLRLLMTHRGRRAEFARLIEEVQGDFIDPTSGMPLPGREDFWIALQRFRVDVLKDAHRLQEAELLQRQVVTRGRECYRNRGESKKDEEQSQAAMASCLRELAIIQKELGLKECIRNFEEALEIAQRIADSRAELDVAYQMAGAYLEPGFEDTDQAEYWLTYALDLTPPGDRIGRGMVLSGLGALAYRRMNDHASSEADRLQFLRDSVRNFELALQVLPPEEVDGRAACHANLGLAYFGIGGDLTRAMASFQAALALEEASSNHHQAGITRLNLARVLGAANDPKRSRLFAEAALRTFASLAPDAEQNLEEAQDFISTLEGI